MLVPPASVPQVGQGWGQERLKYAFIMILLKGVSRETADNTFSYQVADPLCVWSSVLGLQAPLTPAGVSTSASGTSVSGSASGCPLVATSKLLESIAPVHELHRSNTTGVSW